MKKISFIFLFFVLLCPHIKATLTDGSIAPDFTIQDINGNSFNLYNALDNGKTVILEFVATWDENSWAYHNNGSLQGLHYSHGPGGSCSDDVIVLMIETDLSTDLDDLNGTGNNTQGNWLENSPFNVYNLTTESVTNDFLITEFPTIYRICPSKLVQSNGMLSASGHIATITDCGQLNDVAIGDNTAFVQCSPTLRFSIDNINVQQLEDVIIYYTLDGGSELEYSWNGSLAAGSNAEVIILDLILDDGIHEVDCRIVSIDTLAVDMNMTNNCHSFSFSLISQDATSTPYVQQFGNENFPYEGWSVHNTDQSVSWKWIESPDSMLMMNCYAYPDTGQTDQCLLEPFNMTGGSSSVLSFDLAYAPYNEEFYDGLSILVSENCGVSWTEVYFKQGLELATAYQTDDEFIPSLGQWRTECVDLSAYSNTEQLLISFVGHNGWGNNIYIDNIHVSDVCVTNLNDSPGLSHSSLCYPNPADEYLWVEFDPAGATDVHISLLDITGKVVLSKYLQPDSARIQLAELSTKSLPGGCYLLVVDTGESVFANRVMVN